jgi:hypothetical protein
MTFGFDIIFIGNESQFNEYCLMRSIDHLHFNKFIQPSGHLTSVELAETIRNYFSNSSEDEKNVLITVDVMMLNFIHSDDRPDDENIFIHTDDNVVKTARELGYNLGMFSLGDLYAQTLFAR